MAQEECYHGTVYGCLCFNLLHKLYLAKNHTPAYVRRRSRDDHECENILNHRYIESYEKKNQMNFYKIYKISIYNQLFNTHDTSILLLIHLNRSNPITYTIPNSFNAIFDVEIKSCFCWYISLFSLSSWIHDFKLFFWFSDNAFVIRIVNLGINYFVL